MKPSTISCCSTSVRPPCSTATLSARQPDGRRAAASRSQFRVATRSAKTTARVGRSRADADLLEALDQRGELAEPARCSAAAFSSSSVPSALELGALRRVAPDRACARRCLIDSAQRGRRGQERLGQRPREERLGLAGVRRACPSPGAARSATARRRPRPRPATASTRQVVRVRRARPSRRRPRLATSGLCRCRRMNRCSTSSLVERRRRAARRSGRAAGSARRRTPPCRCAGWRRRGSARRCSGRARGRAGCSGCRCW